MNVNPRIFSLSKKYWRADSTKSYKRNLTVSIKIITNKEYRLCKNLFTRFRINWFFPFCNYIFSYYTMRNIFL